MHVGRPPGLGAVSQDVCQKFIAHAPDVPTQPNQHWWPSECGPTVEAATTESVG